MHAALTPTEIFHITLRGGEDSKYFCRGERCSWGLSGQVESVRSCPNNGFSCALLQGWFISGLSILVSQSGVGGGDKEGVQRPEHWGRRDCWGGEWTQPVGGFLLSLPQPYPRTVIWLFFVCSALKLNMISALKCWECRCWFNKSPWWLKYGAQNWVLLHCSNSKPVRLFHSRNHSYSKFAASTACQQASADIRLFWSLFMLLGMNSHILC